MNENKSFELLYRKNKISSCVRYGNNNGRIIFHTKISTIEDDFNFNFIEFS